MYYLNHKTAFLLCSWKLEPYWNKKKKRGLACRLWYQVLTGAVGRVYRVQKRSARECVYTHMIYILHALFIDLHSFIHSLCTTICKYGSSSSSSGERPRWKDNTHVHANQPQMPSKKSKKKASLRQPLQQKLKKPNNLDHPNDLIKGERVQGFRTP